MVYKGGKANRSPSCVFVGNLPEKVDNRDIHDLFDKFGEIKDIDIKHGKTTNYTSYAFVDFASVRSAEDAVDSRDGYEYERYKLRVEFAGEGKPRKHDYDDRRDRDKHRYPPPTRTDYRLVISNLPHGCRWQHLKDHMRKAGPVGYVNISHGKGYVDYMHKSDMKYALRKMDGSELSTPDDTSRIKLRRERRRSRSRDGHRRRSHSRRSRSYSRDRSRSLHRSRSPHRSEERSPDRYEQRSRSVERRSVHRSRSPQKRSADRSRSTERSRTRSVHRSPEKRSRSRSYSERSKASRSRTYSKSASRENFKLNGDLATEKLRYDRDAETETAAETYRESPLQV
ncbi:splicing factor [Theileria orientalis]|uniref:Splicing factor n=1 Tax=Theileria orientalis TaxID=68886 RepID=A0A976QUK7_THEOR|nr:splicing factor [Theileria orientalis]